jgi:predicted phage terminase large subunit-like protein
MVQIPTSLTPEQRSHASYVWGQHRERARTDLYWLVNKILSPPDSRILAPHAHGCIVEHCQKFQGRRELIHKTQLSKWGFPLIYASEPRVPMWELHGSRDNLLLVSRGHLKTTIHTVGHIIQWIINYPDVRVLICTATDEKAQMMVTEIKSHFQFNPRFRHLFPELCPDAKKVSDWGSKTEFTIPGRNRRTKEPTVMTASVGKALASTHHDVVKCSDVVTENNVRTQGQVQEVQEFFGYLDPLREKFESKDGEPNPGWLDIEGTIYDYSDFYQKTLDAKANGTQPWWNVTQRSCWVDRTKRIPLWPERFPALQLDRILAQIGPVLFASQYELNPVSAEDGLATPQQIKKFPAHLIAELMPRYRIHTTVDLSGMDPTTEGDATVFSTCGFDRDGRCDVLSIIKGRFTMDQVVNYFFAIDKVYPNHVDFKVQKDHFSRTLWPILQREQAKRGHWLNIQLTPVSTRISKQQRIRGLQAWFMQGLIRFADNISCMNDVILEILRFPKYEHDDILDTLADQMHNRDGHPVVDVYPDAPKFAFGGPVQEDKFVGFDAITKEARWLHDQIEQAHSEYNAMTGAL